MEKVIIKVHMKQIMDMVMRKWLFDTSKNIDEYHYGFK